ncbi:MULTISPECIES: GNAT family N-acetyltransferase [Actinomyces]|nr:MULTISPECIES: GNAT family N-acetyltransferase [Actinomyces]
MIDLDVVHRWLSSDAYWALGRTREAVQQAADHSLNFGVFDGQGALRGYGRAITDYTNVALLDDIYVEPSARGRGYGLLLAQGIVDVLAPFGLQRIMLATRHAHGLYEKVGFTPLDKPDHWMVLQPPAPTA